MERIIERRARRRKKSDRLPGPGDQRRTALVYRVGDIANIIAIASCASRDCCS